MSLSLFGCGSGGGGGATSATATLAWDAVQAATLSGYRIYYGTSPGLYFQSHGNGLTVSNNVTTYMVTGLSSGTTYYFAVTAFDTSGNESGYSVEGSKVIL
jgi:fibronectin type 3 domain-containing protein